MSFRGNDPARQNRVSTLFSEWVRTQIDDRDGIGNPLHGVHANILREDLELLATSIASIGDNDRPMLQIALDAAKEPRHFYGAAKKGHLEERLKDPDGLHRQVMSRGEVQRLSDALVAERESLFSQKGMIPVVLTIATAAFLQGHVQSSINGGTLYAPLLGENTRGWNLGAMNASPFLAAALLGAPLSPSTNYYLGRRGALVVSAFLIIASSLGAAFSYTWVQVLGARIIGGIGMGIKAVSAPILASETAVGFWRGSTTLTWQLWVACGIMIGLVINLIIINICNGDQMLALRLILGAPVVPSLLLLVAACFCYESPRFYLREDTPDYDLNHAFEILLELRGEKLLALRDLILIRWSNRKSRETEVAEPQIAVAVAKPKPVTPGLTYASHLKSVLKLSLTQYGTLLTTRRLRNAVLSTCTVALAQQLCGINLFAFYSNELFIGRQAETNDDKLESGSHINQAMLYSFGFGLINFLFCLPAMRSIDTRGRRSWLLFTIPLMALLLLLAAVVTPDDWSHRSARKTATIVLIYLFSAVYSPGLGPITFILASESFPLSHREAGASVAISINLLFAGILTIVVPTLNNHLHVGGTLGLFSGLNVAAFLLVFSFVMETRRLSLEQLDKVLDRSMMNFMRDKWADVFSRVGSLCSRRRETGHEEWGSPRQRQVSIPLSPTATREREYPHGGNIGTGTSGTTYLAREDTAGINAV